MEMTLGKLRELVNSYPLNDDDTQFKLYNETGDLTSDPVDIHEHVEVTYLGDDRVLKFG